MPTTWQEQLVTVHSGCTSCIFANSLAGPVASKPMHRSLKTTPIAWSTINAAAAEKKKKRSWFSVCV